MSHLKSILGTGLIALDAVKSDGSYKLFAAGSCPNVFAILQTWGWNARPVGFLGCDSAAEYVLQDFHKWGVDTSYVKQHACYSTPIYVQTIEKDGHTFANQCPFCGEGFRKFQPLREEHHQPLFEELPKTVHVFYLERVTDYGLEWVKHYRNMGALIYFEPNRVDDDALFEEIVKQTHIIKYSNERRFHIHDITNRHRPPLEIETHGTGGICFRVNADGNLSEWDSVPTHPAESFRDACGAGDWFSAFAIYEFENVDRFFNRISDSNGLISLFSEAQQWSAKNCAYDGARGLLYRDQDILWGENFCQFCQENKKAWKNLSQA